MANFRMKRTLPAIIIAAGFGLTLILSITKPTPPAKSEQEKEWGILAVKVAMGTYRPNLELYGSVESPKQSVLTSAISADVIKRIVDEGDQVKKDQLLIELDNSDANLIYIQRNAEVKNLEAQIDAEMIRYKSDQHAILQEKILVDLSEKDVQRREHLFKSQTGSALELDNARKALATQQLQLVIRERAISDHENRLDQLKAQLERAKAVATQAARDVDRSLIKAPFDAKIAKIYVAEGSRVQPGSRIIELFDNKDLEVRTQIPLQYVAQARLALQQHHEIKAKTKLHDSLIEMRLDRLATKVEPGRSGVDGLFMITSTSDLLQLGKTIPLFIELRPINNTIPLPTQALYGLDRVYKVVDNRLQAVKVKRQGNMINNDGSQSILVQSPELKNGDWVMATQLPNAIDGLKVRVKGVPK